MTALPDFDRDFSGPPQRGGDDGGSPPTEGAGGILRMGLSLAGAALVVAAFGIWLLPTQAADPAMMLVKLLISVSLFVAGALFLNAARHSHSMPEIEIDRKTRELRVLTPTGKSTRHVAVHPLDDLFELSFRDGLLNARDRSGQLVVSINVTEARDERNLHKALTEAL